MVAFENLYTAAHQVLRGKRRRPGMGDIYFDLESQLLGLQKRLITGEYRPGAYRSFWITDPKPRQISAAPLLDRIVHHALIQVIEPVFERRFIHHSYACRRGKGTHRALQQFVSWARGYKYVLVMDIQKFFPSIDHGLLKLRLRRSLGDPQVLQLCDHIIDGSNPQEPVNTWFPGDDLLTPSSRRRGIPIGNLTSQFFGNVFLDALDHFIQDECRAGPYLRYVDDLAVFSNHKDKLGELRHQIDRYLQSMRLKLHCARAGSGG